MSVEDRLDVGGVVDGSGGGFARLGCEPVGRAGQCQDLLAGRGPASLFMAAYAGAGLAGPEIDEGPHPLDLHEVLIEGLEEQVFVRRDGEMGRAVDIDGDYAVQAFDVQMCVHADDGVLLIGRVAVPEASGLPGSGEGLKDAEILDRAAGYGFDAFVDIGHDDCRAAVGR